MATAKLSNSDPLFLAWSRNFSDLISAHAAAFGLNSSLAADYAALHSAFATAMTACDPGIRCKSSVATKNAARAALKTSARALASIIQGQANVTDAQRAELGITVRRRPTRHPAPVDAPMLSVVSVSGNTVHLWIRDQAVLSRRGKPPSIDGAAVFSFVGAQFPTSRSEFNFIGNFTRAKFDFTFPASVEPGEKVWFVAQWFDKRKRTGPLSDAVGTRVQGGEVMMSRALAMAA